MASKRKKGDKWEYVVKRTKVLEKPLYFTFDDEAEGDTYCRRLESLLDRGIVPTEYMPDRPVRTVGDLLDRYLREAHPSQKDMEQLNTVRGKAQVPLAKLDAAWVDAWITAMKREERLAPATVRAKVGALARACDWGMRKKHLLMPDHPFRTLPNGYSQYTKDDSALAGGRREDVSRDRRLEPGEEDAIRAVILAGVLARKQRPLKLEDVPALMTLFDLALETAMRLREMYTLEVEQVNLDRRTVFLLKTKNGASRQVPLSTVAVRVLREQLARRVDERWVFPWWSGDTSAAGLRRTTNYLSHLFASIADAAGCPDLHFHDLRHEATSRLFERTALTEAAVMKITGHKSHAMMMRYLKLRGSNLAEALW